jgi:hypothetical protein
VNDEGGASAGEQRIWGILFERNALHEDGNVLGAIRIDLEINRYIAGMRALGILDPVLLSFRVKVAARRSKIRAVTLRMLMYVNCMFAFGKILEVQFDPNALALRCNHCRSCVLSLAGDDGDCHGFGLECQSRAWLGSRYHRHTQENQQSFVHLLLAFSFESCRVPR